MADCAYELYWFDKTTDDNGGGGGMGTIFGGSPDKVTYIKFNFYPEFPVKIYPTRNMGEEEEKSGEEAGKFGKKYAFQKARSRLKHNLSYFGGERDGKYHPAACWKIHISL